MNWTNEPDDGHKHVWEVADGIDTGTTATAVICRKCGLLSAEDEPEEDDE